MAIQHRESRLLELDALRGLAALAVVLYHYSSRYEQIYSYSNGSPIEFVFGKFGVELFFMISGFVIFMSLNKIPPGWHGIKIFTLARFSRLYPAYWAAMTVTFLAVSYFGLPGREVALIDIPANATMLPNLFKSPMVDGVYWTLEKELLFYTWMAVLIFADRLDIIRIVLLIWLFISATHSYIATKLGMDGVFIYKIFKNATILEWIPYFGFGIIAYLRYSKDKYAPIDLLLILIILCKIYSTKTYVEFLFILFLMLIVHMMITERLAFLVSKPLLFLGTISYSLYLVHQNIGYIVIRETLPYLMSPWLSWLLALLISIGMATTITYTIEKPANSLLRRYRVKFAADAKEGHQK